MRQKPYILSITPAVFIILTTFIFICCFSWGVCVCFVFVLHSCRARIRTSSTCSPVRCYRSMQSGKANCLRSSAFPRSPFSSRWRRSPTTPRCCIKRWCVPFCCSLCLFVCLFFLSSLYIFARFFAWVFITKYRSMCCMGWGVHTPLLGFSFFAALWLCMLVCSSLTVAFCLFCCCCCSLF